MGGEENDCFRPLHRHGSPNPVSEVCDTKLQIGWKKELETVLNFTPSLYRWKNFDSQSFDSFWVKLRPTAEEKGGRSRALSLSFLLSFLF